MHKGYCLEAAGKEKTKHTQESHDDGISPCNLKLSQCPKHCIYEDNQCYATDNEGLADKTKHCRHFLSLECPNKCFFWNKTK